jgi:Rrf2 family protein
LAIAVVTDIAINADRPVREREIMLRLALPQGYLRSLLYALVRDGIVKHTLGRSGGYELMRAHYLISADDIVHAVADIDNIIDGSKVQSLIGTEVVIPALRQAEKALSEALRCLTIDMLAHSAMNEGLVVSGGQHLTRKRFR